jgi:hypothetical protein
MGRDDCKKSFRNFQTYGPIHDRTAHWTANDAWRLCYRAELDVENDVEVLEQEMKKGCARCSTRGADAQLALWRDLSSIEMIAHQLAAGIASGLPTNHPESPV